MNSLTNCSADSHLKNLQQWVENDSKEVFAARPGIESVDAFGRAAIHWALIEDGASVKLLQNLLSRKAVAGIPDKDGFYAVHKAALEGSVEQLRLLKSAGASLCARVESDAFLESYSQYGWLDATGLHLAVEAGNHRALELFLESGVDPYIKMWDGSTAMHIAADHLDPEGPDDYEGLVEGRKLCLEKLLARAPESADICDNLGRTPFLRALAKMAPSEIWRFFLKKLSPKKIGETCYVATVKLEYYHGSAQWQKDKSLEMYDKQSVGALLQELRNEGIQVRVDGDHLWVEVNHQPRKLLRGSL